jgi:hypothetical protein
VESDRIRRIKLFRPWRKWSLLIGSFGKRETESKQFLFHLLFFYLFIFLSFFSFFRVPPGDNTTTQSFQLSVVVSYIFSNEEKLKGYEPPPPPSLFKVPYDVFYPFVVNSAPPSATRFSSSSPSVFLLQMISIVATCLYFSFL